MEKQWMFLFVLVLLINNISVQGKTVKWISAADTQHFRARVNGKEVSSDHNVNTRETHNAVSEMNKCSDCDFVMINGDLTEYGHLNEFQEFTTTIRKKLIKPLFYGVGNHDVENNLGDCQDGLTISISKDGCSSDMWYDAVREREKMQYNSPFPFWRSPSEDNEIFASSSSNGVFNLKLAPGVILWQLQNRYFMEHVYYSWMGTISGGIHSSLIDVYNDMNNFPENVHLFSSHYSESSCNNVDQNFKYMCKFVNEVNNDKILAKFEGHLHVSSMSGKVVRAGAMFNGEFDVITFDIDKCEIAVDSFKNGAYTRKGVIRPNRCSLTSKSAAEPLAFDAVMYSDYSVAKNDSVVLRLNRIQPFNEKPSVFLPVSYYNESLKGLVSQNYRFEFECTIQALNIPSTNRIDGLLFPLDGQANPLNIASTGVNATTKFIPNSKYQILEVNNKTITINSETPILDALKFDTPTETFLLSDEVAFYQCE